MTPQWPTRTIGDVCEIVNGGTPRTGVTEYWGGVNRWITPAEMGRRTTPYVDQTERTLTARGLEESSARLLPPYSVILSSRAPIGHLVINTAPMATNQGCKGLIPRPGIDHKFLYYYLTSIVDLLNDLGTGATFRELSGGKLKEVRIPVPSLAEQRRIVGILDEAFEGIAAARASVEKNIENARAVFMSQLQRVFETRQQSVRLADLATEITDGDHAPPPKAASGIPFITISDIVKQTRHIDFANTFTVSEAYFRKLKPNKKPRSGDVLYTVTGATLGIPVVVTQDIEFCFQRHIGLIRPTSATDSVWLGYALLSPQVFMQATIGATGAAQKTVSLSVLRNIQVPKVSLPDQRVIAVSLQALERATHRLASLQQAKLAALDELKNSLLHQAFTGQLAASRVTLVSSPSKAPVMSTTDIHAGVLAIAYRLHEKRPPNFSKRIFGHVKAEKIAHMIEAHLGIDLGRTPVKDAAGPNDFKHLKRVEHRARKAGYFTFRRVGDSSYRLTPHDGMDRLIERTRASLGDRYADVERLIRRMTGMTTKQAEIVATVYAAWNNLLLDGQPITDEAIVHEARERWHPDKLNIPREKFFAAIVWMREKGIRPSGTGKRVSDRSA